MKFTYLQHKGTECQPNNLVANLIFCAVPSYSWCHIWRSCRGVVNWPIWSQGDHTTLRSPLWAWMASYRLGKESRYVVRWSHYHRLGARSDLTCCSGKTLICTKRVISYVRCIKILTTSRLSGHFSVFGLVFFVLKSRLGIARQWSREKFAILSPKPRSHDRLLIYRTWAIKRRAEKKIVRWVRGWLSL